MPSLSPPLVEIQSVSKKYPGSQVFTDLNLAITAGQIIAVLGPNGAGKTTLLRMLAGLATPDSGKICVAGEKLAFERLDLRRRISFLPDFPPLIATATMIENIAMSLHLWEKDRPGIEDAVAEWIEEFGMGKLCRSPVGAFSRGQSYKAALLGLLAVDADLWLLDEPFASGMDPQGIGAFKKHARAAATRGKTILYSTQIIEIAEVFCDQLLIFGDGGMLAFDTPAKLRRDGSFEQLFQPLRSPA